ncbi:hypothetical protein DYI21_07025 [Thalassospira tepidiphila]|jgi:DNA-binding MarR family transcriptional regulator|uniref:hypothetical protein n=1 Tax=Thalassospira tepidiphila TaxID=393657 RepID=UPI001BCA8FC5|nr:hypothetical protein [Thalassospira tepidiphila]MBS8273334.1 hypothetical protein [Thalassospira tepidiphila]
MNMQLLRDVWFALEEIRGRDEDMPASRQNMLLRLYLAGDDGVTYEDLMDEMALTNASVSRNVNALSPLDRHGNLGLNLIDIKSDPEEPRRRRVFLNSQGKRLISRIFSRAGKGQVVSDEQSMNLSELEPVKKELAKKAKGNPRTGVEKRGNSYRWQLMFNGRRLSGTEPTAKKARAARERALKQLKEAEERSVELEPSS